MNATGLLTGAAGRAIEQLEPLMRVGWMQPGEARALVNSARGDVIKALGQPRASAFLAEMHAATRTITHGAEPMHGVRDILGGMIELEHAAARTMTRRLVIGGIAATGALVGAGLLAHALRGGDDSTPMAPGPLRDTPLPGDRQPQYV